MKTTKNARAKEKTIIGLDLGDRKHEVCVLSRNGGTIVMRGKVFNDRVALSSLARKYPGALVVMEVGMNSPWLSRYFEELGHRVVVANPRKVRAIVSVTRSAL